MRRYPLVIALTVVALAIMAPGVRGAEDETLKVFGYLTEASASPVAIVYDQPSFGIPASPTFEVRFMHSFADTDSGPRSHALSSVLWPGELAGNAPPSLLFESFLPNDLIPQMTQEDEVYGGVKQGLIDQSGQFPSYPFKSETFYPAGGTDEYPAGGGIEMRSQAQQRGAAAESTGSRAEFPGVIGSGQMTSRVFAGIRDGIAVAEAVAAGQDISLFDGIIKLKSFRTVQTLSSDGQKVEREGSVDISGLVIDGVTVLGVGAGGPILGDNTIPWQEAMRQIETHLEPRGISVKFIRPQTEPAEAQGDANSFYRVSGIEISMNSYAMGAFADRLPEPLATIARHPGSSPIGPAYNQLPGQLTGFVDSIVQFDQSLSIHFGAVSVKTAASPPFEFTVPPPTGGGFVPPVTPPGPISLPGPTTSEPGASTPPAPAVIGPVSLVGVIGVPAGLGVLALLLALAAAGAMRGFADKATSPAAGASTRCTLER